MLSPRARRTTNRLLALVAGGLLLGAAAPVSAPAAPTGRVTVPAPGAGGWTSNGSARIAGTGLQLTRTGAHQAGSAVYPVPVVTDGLKAAFITVIGGGSGGDGLTFGLLDPARATPTALGAAGGGLGWAGTPGVAVTFDTHRNTGDPSGNFIGVTAATGDSSRTLATTSARVPDLRSGPHAVAIEVSGKTLSVWMDGARLLNATVPDLPATAMPAFTGANGGKTDNHAVRDAVITAASYAVAPPGPNGWAHNGSAALSGTGLVLTDAVRDARGSAVQATAVPSARLRARYTARLGGGTGGDGLALVLLDAAKATPAALGAGGGGLGYAGLPGVAVTLDTHRNPGEPATGFAGVAVGATGSLPRYAAASAALPGLRTGTHAVDVSVTGTGHLLVTVDGTRALDTEVALPRNVRIAFTAATGGHTDQHTVRDVLITY
ncbi:hypothetical protein AB0912_30320 [Streptomyces sp. NPDC007084]|uniref:lectin-like domain-containing protein n=1 Tax=Streptomyces sp. NPDC007084 TaxID=3154313 RepID=UPI0034564CF3